MTTIEAYPAVQSISGAEMVVNSDLRAPMRDGVDLALDVYHPAGTTPCPALIALSPYGKAIQSIALTMPPQNRPSPLWDGCIEAGDIARIVSCGYAHVIADARGSGASDGTMKGNYSTGGAGAGKDVYDLVEWVAQQDWCDGNVGMVGISYLATVMILGAAEKPPHLKAIFCNGGHFDFYELAYHGGVLWFMPRASREGRGGDSGYAVGDIESRTLTELEPAELAARIQARLAEPDIQAWPNLVHVLNYPKNRELWFDTVMNPLNGPFYQNSPVNKAHEIEIPTYLQVKWGRGWTVDGTLETFERLRGPKKLDLQPLPPMQNRPFTENHDEMLRWYDYWLKGIDNGIMDEPAVGIYVEGARVWRRSGSWPLPGTHWRPWFLRPSNRLHPDPEPLPTEAAPPDGFYQAPMTVTKNVARLLWASEALDEDMEMIGAGAAHLFVELDTEDTNFIVKIYDAEPSGRRKLITSGYLKASHRELDNERSWPGNPYHPHQRAEPVTPGTIEEYVLRLYPFSNLFRQGHRIEVELSCNEHMEDENNALLPPESFHLPSGRATTHKIYRDASHPSRLLLPIVTANHSQEEL